MAAAVIGGYIGWLLWGTGLTTSAYQRDARPVFTKVINTKDPQQAPPAGVLPLRGSCTPS
jgi:hypothetical protein